TKVTAALGTGTGAFSAALTGLSANTTYHVRAYAISAAGTAYGDDVSFTTEAADTSAPAAPTITTGAGSTTDRTPTLGGVAEAGSTVTLYVDGVSCGTTVAGGDGSWSFTLPAAVADGNHSITATATDAAGNVSEVSAPAVFQVERLSRFAALSARGPVGTGEQTLTLGFVFGGTGSKSTLVRGVGPGISASVPGAVADPSLSLFSATAGGWAEVGSNDDWAGAAALRSAFASTGAGALADDSKDAALVATLSDRIYTAQVTAGGSGVVLAETYDAALSDRARWLTALSARNQVGTGAETLIAGFVIVGTQPKAVILRAVGPGLTGSVANYLANPEIKLWRLSGGEWTLVGENDDWDGTPETAAAFASAGMGALAAGSKDAALLLTLEPGIYTLQVNGAAGTSGVALAEIYEAAP
nr:hypothetical protein [Opitutaceae bacterium]